MSQIKDIFFIKTILDRATAGSHNGEAGYYSVSGNMFSEGHSCYCDNGNDYYSDLKGIFDCSSTLSGTNWSSSDQHEFDSGHYSMTVVKMAANNYLSILVGGQNVSLNYDGNYYYTQNYYSNYGGTWWRWDYINGELAYIKTYYGGSYATIDENVETTLYSSMPIMMYYNNADRDINYARIAGEQGVGSGGWQVPNPNPTHKIMLNGQQPDDIKLNGATPLKIMLNGVCYFEKQSGGGYLYNWDLTSSAVDPISGQSLQYYLNSNNEITADVQTKASLYTAGTGVTLSDQNDVNGIVLPVNLYTPGNVLEVDFTNFQVTYTMMEWGQIMVETHKCQGSYNTDYGIHWGVGGDYNNWFLTSNYDLGSGNTSYGYCDITNSTEQYLFENSTLKIKVVESPNQHPQWEIYKNDNLIATTPDVNTGSGYPFMPSSMPDAENLFVLSPHYLNAIVTGIRISQS